MEGEAPGHCADRTYNGDVRQLPKRGESARGGDRGVSRVRLCPRPRIHGLQQGAKVQPQEHVSKQWAYKPFKAFKQFSKHPLSFSQQEDPHTLRRSRVRRKAVSTPMELRLCEMNKILRFVRMTSKSVVLSETKDLYKKISARDTSYR